MQFIRSFCVGMMLTVVAGGAQGQQRSVAAYPDKPIRVVVPARVGGTLDIVCRLVSHKLYEAWGQPVIVDNRAGAGGSVGAAYGAKASPDGQTLVCINSVTMGSLPALYRNLQFDMERDFAPVVGLASSALVLVVDPALPVKTLKEFIDYSKARPGKVMFGTSGDPLASELFRTVAKLDMVHVPYTDGNLSTADVITGRISMRIIGMAEAPLVKAGKLRALAVTTPKRSKVLPDVPTMSEGGLPQYQYMNDSTIYAPASTPRQIVAKLNAEVLRILEMPDIRARFDNMGLEAVGGKPEQLAASFKADIASWKKVVLEAGISPLD